MKIGATSRLQVQGMEYWKVGQGASWEVGTGWWSSACFYHLTVMDELCLKCPDSLIWSPLPSVQ